MFFLRLSRFIHKIKLNLRVRLTHPILNSSTRPKLLNSSNP